MGVARYVALLALVLGCGGDGATDPNPPPPPGTIRATTSRQFTPSTLDINAGDTVTWEFEALGHNVTFDSPQPPGTPPGISTTADTTVQREFTQAGTFHYHCTIHHGMSGTVVVH